MSLSALINKESFKKAFSRLFLNYKFINRFFYTQTRNRLSVLMYHRVTKTPKCIHSRQSGMFIEDKMFEKQIEYLMAHYSIISLKDLQEFIENGTALPSHPLLITFDDGYRDNYLYALPILKKRNLPAIIFAATGYIDRQLIPWRERYYRLIEELSVQDIVQAIKDSGIICPKKSCVSEDTLHHWFVNLTEDQRNALWPILEHEAQIDPVEYENLFCSWEELRAMDQAGFSVEDHTISHPELPELCDELIKDEIVASKEMIEAKLDKTVTAVAYPFGIYDHRVLSKIDELGIVFSFTTCSGLTRFKEIKANRLSIPRNGQSLDDTFEIFAFKASGAWKYLKKS